MQFKQYFPKFQRFAKIMVGLNILLPLFLSALISIQGSIGLVLPKAIFKCLGEEHMIFLLENHTSGIFFETVLTWTLTAIIMIMTSNIPDLYFIYSCFKKIESSNDKAKSMISNQAYLNRKR